jgi:hypothetical protein
VLTEAHAKVVGPVHPAGNELKPEDTDRLVAVLPSLVVKVTLYAVLEPAITLMSPELDGVATMELSLVGGGDVPPPPPPPQADTIANITAAAE